MEKSRGQKSISKGPDLIGNVETVGESQRCGNENGAKFECKMKKMVTSCGLLRNDSCVLTA